MRCEAAELELSARMDGERDATLDAALGGHLRTCDACRTFVDRARAIRDAARSEPAIPVPDLTDAIVAALPRRTRAWPQRVLAFAAGAAASVIVLSTLPGNRRVSADEIGSLVAEASRDVSAYEATFDVTERNLRPGLVRRLEASVAFEAPERFRVRVGEDIAVDLDAGVSRVEGPSACPSFPSCASGREVRGSSGREPFDSLLPTDIVVPVRTLVDAARIDVAARGADTVRIRIAHRDATPLFAFLHTAGTWRPFHPLDEVTVTLDRRTWFPLAYEVRAASGDERRLWASRAQVADAPGEVVLSVRARGFRTSADLEPMPGAAPSGGDPQDAILPSDVRGLHPYRMDPSVQTWTRGLAWLKLRQAPRSDRDWLFGNVGPLAAATRLANGSVAYYEPASATLGRRLSIRSADRDLYLETNLPREDLLRVAASIDVRGEAVRPSMPDPGIALPSRLPAGYAPVAVRTMADAVSVYFRRDGIELDGTGIRLHQAPGAVLAPPLDPDVFAVRVRGTTGRYSAPRGELEWIEDGTYRSLRAAGLGLPALLEIASSL